MRVEDLFLAPEDLFRLGNATGPRLTHVRIPKDVDTRVINGIAVVIANGKGVSLATRERLAQTPVLGWVWKISKGTCLPFGLKLINDRPGHYAICPTRNMALEQFVGLLASLALKCQKMDKREVI